MRTRLFAVSLAVGALSACGGSSTAPAALANAAVPLGANPAAFQAPIHGVITEGEAGRSGLDGRTDCAEGDVTGFVSTLALPGTKPALLDGFLTDEAGYLNWSADVAGSTILGEYTAESFDFDSSWVLCWFTGAFVANGQDAGHSLAEQSSVLVAANTMDGTTSVHLVSARDNAMAILAPAPPVGVSDEGPETRRPSQPKGVLLVAEPS